METSSGSPCVSCEAAILPSFRKWTFCAAAATCGSCVTTSMALFSEVARRLVRKNDVRLGKKRARDRDALLLAAGELLWPLVENALDSERGDEGGETGFVGLCAVEAERKDDVVANRSLVEEVERLEHYADVAAPELRRLRVAHLHDVPPADENLARVGRKEPRREMEESGLSAPARTHQRLEPTLLDCEGEVLENLLHAISAAYAARLQSLHVSSDFCF